MGNSSEELLEEVKDEIESEEVIPEAETIPEEVSEECKEEAEETPAEENKSESEEIPAEESKSDSEETLAEETAEQDEAEDTQNSESENEEDSQPKENIFKRIANKINFKKVAIILGSVVAVAAAIYFAGVWYYSSHFFFNTDIGYFDCSNLTVEEAEKRIHDGIDNYVFTIYEKSGKEESITGKDIELSYEPVKNIKELKAKQNPFEWITDYDNRELPISVNLTFNEDRLYNLITELDCAAESRKNMDGSYAGIYYDENGKYSVKDDGTKDVVSISMLFSKIKDKVNDLCHNMSLVEEGCYVGLAGDDKMKETLDTLNKYAGTKVTYPDMGDNQSYVDGGSINEWLSVAEDYTITLDKEKIAAYVSDLAYLYNTVGKERKFKTTAGEEIAISRGNYGWIVDNAKETEALYENIMNGEQIEREPVYRQRANGFGNYIKDTYVEISLSGQHLWFYKDGQLIIESNVVTGNPYRGNATPPGVYSLAYKARNTVLRGPGYASPVSYWMPFNGGIGLHDATWRGAFGGRIYLGGGSHGCVNLPFNVAAKIYEHISAGDPVVLY